MFVEVSALSQPEALRLSSTRFYFRCESFFVTLLARFLLSLVFCRAVKGNPDGQRPISCARNPVSFSHTRDVLLIDPVLMDNRS